MNLGRSIRPRQFFASVPVPCPYLPSKVERKLVVELAGEDASALFTELSRAGFRRSHGYAYRPACRDCRACVPVRIHADAFAPTRSLRKVLSRNSDLTATEVPPVATAEQYRLFLAYQQARHPDSEMATMSLADYRMMVEATPIGTSIVEIRDANGALVGASLVDRTGDGLSAVYSFFDPNMPRRSLGTFAILWMVARARELGLSHVYLGYWIGGSDTMDYKRRFPAIECLRDGAWVPAAQGSTTSLP